VSEQDTLRQPELEHIDLLAYACEAATLIPDSALSTILGREVQNRIDDVYDKVLFCKGATLGSESNDWGTNHALSPSGKRD
jgi:hypothetical protein